MSFFEIASCRSLSYLPGYFSIKIEGSKVQGSPFRVHGCQVQKFSVQGSAPPLAEKQPV